MGRGKHYLSRRWLKAWWQERGDAYLAAVERKEALRVARQKRRPKCKCKAYPWPHRPGGGLCRYPDPPTEIWKGKVGANSPAGRRYRGTAKSICKQYGWHPIRDRARIHRWMPRLYVAWCKRHLREYYWALLREGRIDEHGRLRATPDWFLHDAGWGTAYDSGRSERSM